MARTPRGLPEVGKYYSGGPRIRPGTIMTDADGVDWIVVADEHDGVIQQTYWSQVRYQSQRQLFYADKRRKAHRVRALLFYALALFTAMLCYAIAQSLWFVMLPLALVFGVIGFVFHRKYRWEKERHKWTRLQKQ